MYPVLAFGLALLMIRVITGTDSSVANAADEVSIPLTSQVQSAVPSVTSTPIAPATTSTTVTSTTTSTTTTTTTIPETTTTTSTTTTIPVDPQTIFIADGTNGDALARNVHVYRVEVEAATGLDPEEVARFVDETLFDERSWTADGDLNFYRTDGNVPSNGSHIIFASPDTVDFLCHPLDTDGYFSCRNGQNVVLNAERWANAVPNWATSLTEYRQYLVNHEVGHALGQGHVDCLRPGALAPVMMQQSKSIGACLPNSWPFPDS